MKIATHTLKTVVSFGTMALLLWMSTFWALSANAQSAQASSAPKPEIRDFAGRLIPKAAHDLIGMAMPPEVAGKIPAKVPGWEHDGGLDSTARHEFRGDPVNLMLNRNIWISLVRKGTERVGIVKVHDKSKAWIITDIFAIQPNEAVTVQCNPMDHRLPLNNVLVGITKRGDKRFAPSPPPPTDLEMVSEFQRNGKYPPRSCLGNIQKARIAAFLDLKTGQLQKYDAYPVYCISPFFDPCPP